MGGVPVKREQSLLGVDTSNYNELPGKPMLPTDDTYGTMELRAAMAESTQTTQTKKKTKKTTSAAAAASTGSSEHYAMPDAAAGATAPGMSTDQLAQMGFVVPKPSKAAPPLPPGKERKKPAKKRRSEKLVPMPESKHKEVRDVTRDASMDQIIKRKEHPEKQDLFSNVAPPTSAAAAASSSSSGTTTKTLNTAGDSKQYATFDFKPEMYQSRPKKFAQMEEDSDDENGGGGGGGGGAPDAGYVEIPDSNNEAAAAAGTSYVDIPAQSGSFLDD